MRRRGEKPPVVLVVLLVSTLVVIESVNPVPIWVEVLVTDEDEDDWDPAKDAPASLGAGSAGAAGAAGSSWPWNIFGNEGTAALACAVRVSGSPGPARLALQEHSRIPSARNERW